MDDEERYLFETQGFLHIPQALSPDELRRLNASVDSSPHPPKPPAPGLLPQLTDLLAAWPRPASEPFRELLDHAAIAPRLDEMLGEGHRLDMDPVAIVMSAGDGGGPLHGGGSDRASLVQSAFWHAGRFYTGMLVVEFFLAAEGPGDGGLGTIAGSHKAELPLPASIKSSDMIPGTHEWAAAAEAGARHRAVTEINAAAGDAVIFAEACSHLTLPWTAQHQRRTLLYRFCPGFQCSQYPHGVKPVPQPAWVLNMTPAQQAVMEPPGNGYGINRAINQGDRPRIRGGVLVPPQPPGEPAVHGDPPLMTTEQAYLFDLSGYLHIKQALSSDEVAHISAALDRREGSGGLLEGSDSEPFRDLLVHRSTVPALNTILGEGWRLDSGPNVGSEEQTEGSTNDEFVFKTRNCVLKMINFSAATS